MFHAEKPEILFEPGTYDLNPLDGSYDISTDGRRFLMANDAVRAMPTSLSPA